jgi:hypothetical protein
MVDLLDKLAQTLDVQIADFFIAPQPGEQPPKALPGGRNASKLTP